MDSWLNQNKVIVLATLVLMSLLGGLWFYKSQPQPAPLVLSTLPPTATVTSTPQPTATATPKPETPTPTFTPAPLRVYISGEVLNPDVYFMPPGSIMKDLIVAAGGTTDLADLDIINQALELKDQQHIHIPAEVASAPTPPVIEGGVDTPQRSAPAISIDPPPPTSAPAPAAPLMLNINTATAAELEQLPGIGPAIAQRIVDYRTANGNFAAIESLTEVKGIGPATFDKLKAFVTVN